MITSADARVRAQARVAELAKRAGIDLAIDDDATLEKPWCWVLFYTSREYVETRRFSDAFAGNGPLVVEKATGTRMS